MTITVSLFFYSQTNKWGNYVVSPIHENTTTPFLSLSLIRWKKKKKFKRLTVGRESKADCVLILSKKAIDERLILTMLLPIRRSVLSSSCARSQSKRMFSLCSWLVYALSVKSCVLSMTVSNAAVRVSRQPGPRRVILVVSTSLSKCFNAENAVLLSQSSCCGLWN